MNALPAAPSPRRRLAAIFLAPFLVSIEFYILSIALPVMMDEFHASLSVVSLTILVYMITMIGGTLAAGALAERLGQARATRWAFLGFAATSVPCGLASSIGWLIFWRGVQGLFGAFLYVSGPALIQRLLPAERRDQGFTMMSMASIFGVTLGPTIGSVVTTRLGWSWNFYLFVPVCFLGWWLLRGARDDAAKAAKAAPFDRGGAAYSILFSAGLVFGLNQGGEFGWTSWPILASLLGSALCIVLFLRHERRTPQPVFDLAFFHNRDFLVGNLGLAFFLFFYLGTAFHWPFYLIDVGGYSTEAAGFMVVLRPAGMLVANLLAAWVFVRLPARKQAAMGVLLALAGCLLFQFTDIRDGWERFAAVLVLIGLGMGFYYPRAMKTVMDASPKETAGEAAAAMSLVRSFSQMLGVLVFETIYSDLYLETSSVDDMQHGYLHLILFAFVILLPVLVSIRWWPEVKLPADS